MQSEIEDKNVVGDEVDDTDAETDIPEGTVVMAEDSFDDSDISMEVNVEGLVAELEKSQDADVAKKKEIRHKLEELAEEKSFEDTYAVDFDND